MLSIPAYRDLARAIQGLPADAESIDVISAISRWVQNHPELTVQEPFSNYGFDLIKCVAGQIESYAPGALDGQAIDRIKMLFSRLKRSDDGGIAQLVRDTMEELLAPEVDSCCGVCGENFMQAFAGQVSSQFVLQCPRCGHCQFRDGSDARGETVRFLAADEVSELGSS